MKIKYIKIITANRKFIACQGRKLIFKIIEFIYIRSVINEMSSDAINSKK